MRVITETPDTRGRVERRVYIGKKVKSDYHDPANTIRLTTGNSWFPERVIHLENVMPQKKSKQDERAKKIKESNFAKRATAREKTTPNKRATSRKKSTPNKRWKVRSSDKSTLYIVKNNPWSCTCKGYQFRQYCRHIKEKQSG